MRYFMVVDDCGWRHAVQMERDDLNAADVVALVPYTRYANELTKEEFGKVVESLETEKVSDSETIESV